MTLDFSCQDCDATFEVELSDLVEDPSVECPSCEARAPKAALEGMISALDDLFSQLALLRRKFTVVLEVESDELPTPYEREAQRPAAGEMDEGTDDGDASEDGWQEKGAEIEEEEER